MNFVFISPSYPPRYYHWVRALKQNGCRVLGIGDTPTLALDEHLDGAMDEYVFIHDLSDIHAMVEAIGYFERRYGHIDFIESNNEWWLAQDAKLRQWFDVRTGFFPDEMEKIKAKASMKRCFNEAGVKTARYIIHHGKGDLEALKAFASEVGYPLFAKPNIGVGATHTFKINDEKDLVEFESKDLGEDYIVEEYIEGFIVSFDGICDINSDVPFCTSDHFPFAVADIVKERRDHAYFDIPFGLPFPDIDGKAFEEMGRRVIKAFGIKQRPFHIEFFVLTEDKPGFASKGEVVALECNMRSPGGFTTDLMNFGNSVDVYDIWAKVIMNGTTSVDPNSEKFYAVASHRRDEFEYAHTIDEIKAKYKDSLKMSGRYPKAMSDDMCNSYFYARFKTYEEALEFDAFVREKKK